MACCCFLFSSYDSPFLPFLKQVDYIDIPKRTLLSVPGYEELIEFGVITSFAYPLEDGSGESMMIQSRGC